MENISMPGQSENEILPEIKEQERQKDIEFIDGIVERGGFSVGIENHYYGYPKEVEEMLGKLLQSKF